MAESFRPSKDDLRRQVTQHLASMRAAGVQWLPKTKNKIEDRGLTIDQEERTRLEDRGSSIEEADTLFQSSILDPPSSTANVSLEQRRQALQVLAKEVCQCSRCPELVAT